MPPLKAGEAISANARQLFRFQDLVAANKRLQKQVSLYAAELVQLEEFKLENQRLRNILSLPEAEKLNTQTAILVGRDSSNWSKTVLINKGLSSGIKPQQAVVFGKNLVGKVIEAGPRTSKVALIVDFSSKVPAKILRTREEGLVFGLAQSGFATCKIKYLQDVQVGDQVISSGLGRTYPKGFLIGTVIKVEDEQSRLYKVAEIKTAVRFSHLEEVMVIIE
ncbi:rod shape-determining protein MreC [Candidatus Omnitrophota bacterium]